jgi:heme/copper-type cytochrome/quinol oxidase subunit 2
MRAAAVVESQGDFDAWVKDQEKIQQGVKSTGAPGPYDVTAFDKDSSK